jgi:hypothetical protein
LAYIAFILIVERLTVFNSVGTMNVAFSSPVLWLNIVLICGFSGLIEYFILCFFYVFQPSTVTILQRIFKQYGLINSCENLPKSIKDKLNIYNEIEGKLDLQETKKDEIVNVNVDIGVNDNDNINDINNQQGENKIENKEENINTNINANNNIDNNNMNENNVINSIINKDNNNDDNIKKTIEEKNNEIKSGDALLYKNGNSEDKKTDAGKEQKSINNDKKSNKTNKTNKSKKTSKTNTSFDNVDIGENYGEEFSEEISKEENINIGSSSYFTEPWRFKKK